MRLKAQKNHFESKLALNTIASRSRPTQMPTERDSEAVDLSGFNASTTKSRDRRPEADPRMLIVSLKLQRGSFPHARFSDLSARMKCAMANIIIAIATSVIAVSETC